MSTGGDPSGPRRDQDRDDEQTFADVLNAFSFGNGRRRRKAPGDPGAPQDRAHLEKEETPPAPEEGLLIGQAHPVDDQAAGWGPGSEGAAAWGPADGGPEAPAASVRAYVWTGGRTRSRHHFEVETLVSAAVPSSGAVAQPHRTVLELCREPRSVAEVAALLAMPLGVAMVLLGDMTDHGLVVVHEAATGDGGAPSPTLMERVLTGLRRL
jgi:hypothetical protein